MLDIARVRRKALKKEEKKTKMRKSQTKTINIFLLLFFYIEKFIFCQKIYWENLVYLVFFVFIDTSVGVSNFRLVNFEKKEAYKPCRPSQMELFFGK